MASDKRQQDEIENLLQDAKQAADVGEAAAPATSAAEPVEEPPPTGAGGDAAAIEAGSSPVEPRAPSPDAVSPQDVEMLLNQAQAAIASIDAPGDLPPGIKAFDWNELAGSPASTEAASLELVRDVQLDLKIELGRTHMHLEDVLQLKRGAVVPLDKLAGDPVDVYVNGRLIARGEVLVLNDNFCVRVTELIVGDSVAGV